MNMGLIGHKIRVLIRSHGTPIRRKVAERWHFRTTAVYNVSAFSLFCACVYYVWKNQDPSTSEGKRPGEITTPYEIAKKFGHTGPYTVVSVTGFNKVSREVFNEVKEEGVSDDLEKPVENAEVIAAS